MTRAKTNKFYRTFVKGLITEAGYLTYPEDASMAEMNTLLSRKGNRSRRLGLDYQEDYELVPVDISDDYVNEYVWKSVNNDPLVNFACIQIGKKIHFFDMNDEPLSTQYKSFTVDLSAYKIPSAPMSSVGKKYASMAGGNGYLFVAHPDIDPVSIEYKPAQDQLVVVPIVIQVRDLEGVYDGLANDEEPKTLSPQHHYNLRNQGWVSPGSKSVDISTPTYPVDPATPPSTSAPTPTPTADGVYYDPYIGDRVRYWKTRDSVFFPLGE